MNKKINLINNFKENNHEQQILVIETAYMQNRWQSERKE